MEWTYARFYPDHRLVQFTHPHQAFLDAAKASFHGHLKMDSDASSVRLDARVDVMAIVALLGEEGWEMVASDGPFGLWFKRPRESTPGELA